MQGTAKPEQLDLFTSIVGDLPLRDDREGMSVPLVSLAKGKRTTPIKWRSSDGERYVHVTADATHGMATIWDMDVLIWAVSQINAALEAGKPISREVGFQAYDMLRAIRRGTSGKHYRELEESLRRLKGTTVETNIRAVGRRHTNSFGLLDGWRHETDDATGRSLGMRMTLPQWIFDGVMKHRDVLAIPPAYFDLSSGIARLLYRLARRHAGKQATGWQFTMRELHARSGSVQPLKEFARGVREAAVAGVPEYRLEVRRSQTGEELVAMVRDPAKVGLPQRRDLVQIGLPESERSGDGHVGSPAAGHVGSPAKTRGITRRNRQQLIENKALSASLTV